jgi:hypothetical protein
VRECLAGHFLISHHRQHVFRDLMAYSCTFEHCASGLFESRIAWKNHEIAEHRRNWRCPSCQRGFATRDSVTRHMSAEHPATENGLLHALVTAASPQHTSAKISDCPFCDDYRAKPSHPEQVTVQHEQASYDFSVSLDVHQRHLGRHMEQLALFAAPPADNDDGDDDAAKDDIVASVEDEDYENEDEDEDHEDEDDDKGDDDDEVVKHSSQLAENSTDSARDLPHLDKRKRDWLRNFLRPGSSLPSRAAIPEVGEAEPESGRYNSPTDQDLSDFQHSGSRPLPSPLTRKNSLEISGPDPRGRSGRLGDAEMRRERHSRSPSPSRSNANSSESYKHELDRLEREKREEQEREEREWQEFERRRKEKQEKEDCEKMEAQAKLDDAMRKRLAETGFTQSQINDIMDKEEGKKHPEPTRKTTTTITTASHALTREEGS